MKNLLFAFAFILLTACGSKHTRTLLSSGNYDEAINSALSNLRTNKDKKGNQDYVYILEESFAKAKERDLNTVKLLEIQNNPANLEKIYNTYLQLNNRQEKIKPILPLKLLEEGRNAQFPFDNYNNQIVSNRNDLSDYLYANANNLLKTSDKMNFRKAYDDLNYLNEINPNYKNTLSLINEAHNKGIDYVYVSTKNETNMVIPSRLQNDLLDFNTYQLNDVWTTYHGNKLKGTVYNYEMTISFREIFISPEQIREREFIKEKKIKDGQIKLLDENKREVLDNKGKVVMVDNFKNVTVQIFESRQFKSCQITTKVDYIDLENNQLTHSIPLSTEFIFENIYSTYKGDRRASDDDYFTYFDKKSIPFPSSEQMIYDTGENLKIKIKELIVQNKFKQ